MDSDYQTNSLSSTFRVSIPRVLAKSSGLITILLLLGYVAVNTNSPGMRLTVGVLFLLLTTYYSSYLFELARLNDSVTLTKDGLLSNIL